ncbi:hypothetical protein C8R45DRAFT_780484, partial [Mycena sanguinolenta]
VTDIYQKALNTYLYIPWNSCHSENSKRAWVKGELIRYVRICSKEPDFAKIRLEFDRRLRARGYPGRWLQRVFGEIEYKAERINALNVSTASAKDDEPELHVLKLTHNPVWDCTNLRPIWHDLEDTWTTMG